jgi:hypothetical protein
LVKQGSAYWQSSPLQDVHARGDVLNEHATLIDMIFIGKASIRLQFFRELFNFLAIAYAGIFTLELPRFPVLAYTTEEVVHCIGRHYNKAFWLSLPSMSVYTSYTPIHK